MCAQPSKKSHTRTALKFLVVFAVLFAAVWFIRGMLRPVAHVAPVVAGLATNSVSASVLVAAERISPLTSEIGGRLQKSELDPGKIVKEGDVLAQIDTGDIDLEIEKRSEER